MLNQECPCCKQNSLSKSNPRQGNVYFIGSADTQTKQIFADNGFICDLYVCSHCGSIQLKMVQQ